MTDVLTDSISRIVSACPGEIGVASIINNTDTVKVNDKSVYPVSYTHLQDLFGDDRKCGGDQGDRARSSDYFSGQYQTDVADAVGQDEMCIRDRYRGDGYRSGPRRNTLSLPVCLYLDRQCRRRSGIAGDPGIQYALFLRTGA